MIDFRYHVVSLIAVFIALADPQLPGALDLPSDEAVRADGALADAVATVDNVASSAGRLAALWALAQLMDGEAGHYALAADAEGLLPPPPTDLKPVDGAQGPQGSPRSVGGPGTRSRTR